MKFAGFPSRGQATVIPASFFSDVLPRLAGDPIALGVALYAMRALTAKRGSPRYITPEELEADPACAAYIAATGVGGAGEVESGLARAATEGVLVTLQVRSGDDVRALYFLNTPSDRRGMAAVREGRAQIAGWRPAPETAAPPSERGIFTLYESLVGPVTPLIADDLIEAERLYPPEWLEEAFREAAAQNARSWRYVSRILERWAHEGRDHAKTQRDPAGDRGDRYFAGKYGRILKQRLKP